MNSNGNAEVIVKEGDVLFKHSRYNGYTKLTVVKVTPKGSIRLSNDKTLRPDLTVKGKDAWDTDSYYHWSEELEQKWALENLQSEVNAIYSKVDVYTLQEQELNILLEALEKIIKK